MKIDVLTSGHYVIAKHFEIEELREKLSKVEAEEADEERPVSAAQQASEAERRRGGPTGRACREAC